MATYSEFSAFIQPREFDNSGRLLANGTIAFYEAGTSTLADVFSDSTGTPLANPVLIDGAGTFRVFGEPTAHKVIIRDADGVQIWEQDPCFPFGSGGNAAGSGTSFIVDTYADLRALPTDYDIVFVRGAYAVGDGGAGAFYRVPQTLTDNAGTILRRAGSTYIREYSGWIEPAWFGVLYSTPSSQTTRLQAALAAGPTQITGLVYLDADAHLTGVLSVLKGGFYTNTTPRLFLDGILHSASANAFGAGITVVMGRSVAQEIRLSWFATFAQSLCSVESYRYLVDRSEALTAGLVIPPNLQVDFVGGSVLTVSGGDVSIGSLAYRGEGQIIRFAAIGDIQGVDLGDVDALLEWFGGSVGSTWGADNSIPARAALAHGRVRLLEGFYRVPFVGSAWALSRPVAIVGAGKTVSEIEIGNDIACADLSVTDATLSGPGAITATGAASFVRARVQSLVERVSASGEDINAAAATPLTYFAGQAGGLRISSDLSFWTPVSGPSDTMRSVAKGPRWVASGDSGRVWHSVDGITWASVSTGSQTIRKVRWLNGLFVAVGDNGKISTSADGITWLAGSSLATGHLYDVAWTAASGWVIVGAGAKCLQSTDAITWTVRPLPGAVTGDLYAIASAGSVLVASGALTGAFVRSTDGISWSYGLLPGAEIVYAAAADGGAFALCGSAGGLFVSTDAANSFARRAPGGSSPLLSIETRAGDWVIGATGGTVYHSTDLVAFASSSTGGTDVLALSTLAPAYALAGANGSLQVSTDGVSWALVDVDGVTAGWNRIQTINGLSILCGDSGKLYYTTDFVSFKQVPISTAANLQDIAWTAGLAKWTVVGSGGYIASTPDITAAAPVWTLGSGAAGSLRRIVWDGAKYWVAEPSNGIYTSADALTWALSTSQWRGVVYGAAVGTIMYGDGGAIVREGTAGAWFDRVTSGTTASLRCGAYGGGVAIVAGAGGVLLRSTNGTSWTTISGTGSDQINAVAFDGGNFLFCTSARTIYRSTDLGLTWTLVLAASSNALNDIASSAAGTWFACGAGGYVVYSTDGITWAQIPTGRSEDLYSLDRFPRTAGAMDVAGDGGVVLNINPALTASPMTPTQEILALGKNWRKMVGGILLASTGEAYAVDPLHISASLMRTLPATTVNVCKTTSGKMRLVGVEVWEVDQDAPTTAWTKLSGGTIGIRDMVRYGSHIYMAGDNGLIGDALVSGSAMYPYASFVGEKDFAGTIYTADPYVVLNALPWQLTEWDNPRTSALFGVSSYNVAGYSGGRIITARGNRTTFSVSGALSIDSSEVANMTNSTPAQIVDSTLDGVSLVASAKGSTFRRPFALSGVLDDCQTVGFTVAGDSAVSACDITEDRWSMGLTGNAAIKVSSGNVTLTGCAIDSFRPLFEVVGASSSIALVACSDAGGFAGALSNGVGRITLAGCGVVRNAGADAIDGASMDDAHCVALRAPATITGTLTGWYGLPGGSTTDGTSITMGAAAKLGPTPGGAWSFRYAGNTTEMQLLEQLGGQIEVTVEGANMGDVRPAATLYRASMFDRDEISLLYNWWVNPNNESASYGLVAAGSGAAKVVSRSNVWGGLGRVLGGRWPNPNRVVVDQWGDTSTTEASTTRTIANAVRICVFNQGTGELPIGAKMTIRVIPKLPMERQAFDSLFQARALGVDAYQKIEKQQLVFDHARPGEICVTRAKQAGSVVADDRSYMSFNASPSGSPLKYTADSLLITDATTGRVMYWPTDKAVVWPAISASLVPVEIKVRGIEYSAVLSTDFTSGSGGVTGSGHNRIDRHIVENGAWDLVTRTVYTHPEGV